MTGRSFTQRATIFGGALVALLLWCLLLPQIADADETSPQSVAAPLETEDPPERFVPLHPRTEDDENRLQALSLFAAARVQEQEEHWHRALRLYQRAVRYDSAAQPARRAAVLLALRQGRVNEAARYLGNADCVTADTRELHELGELFEKMGHYSHALKLYRQARSLQADKHSSGYVVTCFDVGRMSFIAGDFQESAAAVAEVMDALDHPDDYDGLDDWKRQRLGSGPKGREAAAQIYLLFAEALLSAERYDQAAAALEKANGYAPDEPGHAYRMARIEQARKHPERALELLQRFFDSKQTGHGAMPYELLSNALADLQRSDKLIPQLVALHQRDPGNAELALYLGARYQAAEQWDDALPLYRGILAKAPARGENRGLAAAAYRGLAIAYRRLKQTQPLLMLLGEVAGATGNLALLGDEATSLAADADLVTALVAKAHELHHADPDNLGYGPRLAAALLALDAQRYDAAKEFFNLAMKVKREDARTIYLIWALGLLGKEQSAHAAEVLKQAIDERVAANDDPTLHFYWSRALLGAERPEEALDAARHALSLNRDNIQLASQVPLVLYIAKRYDEAADSYRELMDRFDERDQSDVARALLHSARMVLSGIAVQQRDLATSEEWLEQVLDEFPDDIGAHNDLGYLWADEGKHLQTALAMIEQAVAAEPDNAAYRDSLGWVYHRLGRHAEAVAELEKAVVVESPDGVIFEHLGDAAHAAGANDKARKAWQKALAAFEQQQDAEKIKRVKEKLNPN